MEEYTEEIKDYFNYIFYYVFPDINIKEQILSNIKITYSIDDPENLIRRILSINPDLCEDIKVKILDILSKISPKINDIILLFSKQEIVVSWNICNYEPNIDRSICKDKLKMFLEDEDELFSSVVNKIVDVTLYIKTEEMIRGIKIMLLKFISSHPVYNLFIPRGKIGSEHFILLRLREYLSPVKIIYDYNTEDFVLDNNYPILIINDAIYTSINACGHVDYFRYDTGYQNDFYIVTYLMGDKNVPVIEQFGCKVYSYLNLGHLTLRKLFDKDTEKVSELLDCETELVLPIYFDHKIANSFGSYQLYHNIIRNPVSRDCIDIITTNDLEELISSLSKH